MAGTALGDRSVIHPKQVAAANAAFTPSDDEIARAEKLIAAFEQATADGRAVAVVDGEFIDAAVMRWARSVLNRVPSAGSPTES